MRRFWHRLMPAIVLAAPFCWLPPPAAAQEMYRGAPILTVLPKDAIPAMDRPEFVTVAEADKIMQPAELVISVRDGTSARAYSTWLLHHHEIVNDVVEGVALAITW